MAKAPSPRFVTTVEGVVQGRSFTANLGLRTYVKGGNAKGKDRIIRALSLAMRGTADDIDGKDDVAQSDTLAELMGPDATSLVAKVADSLGNAASFTLTRKETGALAKEHHPFKDGALFVLADMLATWDSTDTKGRRRWLLDVAGRTLTHEAIVLMLPEPLRIEYEAVASAVRSTSDAKNLSASELLVLVRAEVNRRKLEAGRQITSAEKTANDVRSSSTSHGDMAPTPADIEAARLRVEQLEYELQACPVVEVQVQVAPTAPVAKLTPEHYAHWNKLSQDVASVDGYIGQTAAWLSANPKPDMTGVAALQAQVSQYTALADRSAELLTSVFAGECKTCPLCTTAMDAAAVHQIEQYVASLRTWLAGQEAQLAVPNQIAQVERQLEEAKVARAKMVEQMAAYQRTYDAERAEAAEYAAWFSRSQDQADGDAAQRRAAVETRASIGEQLRQARERHTAMVGHAGRQEAVNRALATAHAETVSRDRYTRLLDAVDKAIGQSLGRIQSSFVEAVRAYMPAPETMPEGGVFDLRLTENGKDVARMGLADGHGHIRTALSGAERTIVFSAVCAAIVDIQGLDFAVLIPEDRALLSETLTAMMRALAKSRCQIVVANVVKVPKIAGWKILDLDAIETSTGDSEGAGGVDTIAADAQARAAADDEAQAARAIALEEGASTIEADEAARLAAEAVLAAEAKTKVELPAWCHASALPKARGVVAVKTYAADLLKIVGAKRMATIASEAACDVVEVPEAEGPAETWRRYPSGLVVRLVQGRAFIYDDEDAEDKTTGPVWSRETERGPLLAVVPTAQLRSGWKAVFGADSEAQPADTVPAAVPGTAWSRMANGAVLWRGPTETSIYAGTSGATPAAVTVAVDGSGPKVESAWRVE